jgi:hypothetical protein
VDCGLWTVDYINMKKLFFPILILAFACTTKKTENSAATDSLKVDSTVAAPAVDSVKTYQGTFNRSSIIMKLKWKGDSLSGSYTTDGKENPVELKGYMEDGLNFTLDEPGKRASFSGAFSVGYKDASGFWGKKGKNDYLSFRIKRIDPVKNFSYSFDTIRQSNAKPSESFVSFKFKSSDLSAFDKLNKALAEGISSQKKDFEDELKDRFPDGLPDQTASTDSLSDEDLSAMGPQWDIESKVNYYNAYLSDSLVVLAQDVYYYPGGMHPNTFLRSVNYSVPEKKILALKDLFSPGTDYLNLISKYCISKLKKKLAKDGVDDFSSLEEAAAPDADNFDVFFILEEGLLIYFNPHIINMADEEPTAVLIPYSEMKGMMRVGPVGAGFTPAR